MNEPNFGDFRKFALSKTRAGGTAVDKHMRKLPKNYLMPYIMEERDLHVTQMDVFSRMMFDRVIFLGTPIDSDVANVIQAQLLYLESTDSKKPIQLYINSPGGGVYSGLGIYDTMHFIQPSVATTCIGLCASMAAVLLAAGTKGERGALAHSRIMIHQPSGSAEGMESDIDIMAREIKSIKSELFEILANHTGQSVKKIEKDSDRDRWMRAPEAKDYGIVDNILENREK